MLTVSHAGDAGDVIYSLPAVHELAKRHGAVALELYPTDTTRSRMTPLTAESLRTLIERQDYVNTVAFVERPTGVLLDAWRTKESYERELADKHLEGLGLALKARDSAWLSVLRRKVARVVFHRSPRYHNPWFPWQRVLSEYARDAVFVGSPGEHVAFVAEFGVALPFYRTDTFLALAEVIAGSELFVGNQSSPFAVAEGLKHNAILEVCRTCVNCCYDRPNVVHGYTSNTIIPSLTQTAA